MIEPEKLIYINVLKDIGWVAVPYQCQLYSTVLKLVNFKYYFIACTILKHLYKIIEID